MVRKLALAIFLTSVAGIASATVTTPDRSCTIHWFLGIIPYEVCKTPDPPNPVAAPEIDATSAVAGMTLMIGALAVLRGRRSKIAKA